MMRICNHRDTDRAQSEARRKTRGSSRQGYYLVLTRIPHMAEEDMILALADWRAGDLVMRWIPVTQPPRLPNIKVTLKPLRVGHISSPAWALYLFTKLHGLQSAFHEQQSGVNPAVNAIGACTLRVRSSCCNRLPSTASCMAKRRAEKARGATLTLSRGKRVSPPPPSTSFR